MLILQDIWFCMFSFIKSKLRKRALNAVSVHRKGSAVLPDCARGGTLGVVYSINKPKDIPLFEELTCYLQGLDLSCYGIVVETGKCFKDKIAREQFGESCLSRGFAFVGYPSLDWIGVPQKSVRDDFWSREYDMVVCFNQACNFTLDYIVSSLRGGFLVGMNSDGMAVYDLVLEQGVYNLSPVEYMQRLFGYLQMMRGGVAHRAG